MVDACVGESPEPEKVQNEHDEQALENNNSVFFHAWIEHESILFPIPAPRAISLVPIVEHHYSKGENTHQSKNQ